MLSKVNTLKKQKNSKKGFTLVELVIVIAVLAIIAAIAIPTVSNVIKNANKSADDSNAQAVELAIKTTATQISSGTYKDTTTTLAETISVALTDNGMGGVLPTCKQGTDFKYYYNKDTGKIQVSNSTPAGCEVLDAGTTTLKLACPTI